MLFNSLLGVNSLECISIKNEECTVIPEIVDINCNNPIFYPFSIKVNKCNRNCNNINDPSARICVPDGIKNVSVKVFNLMVLSNETRHIKWHKTCKCICRLDRIICNSKQRWNEDKCRCACKDIFNPSNCECECDKSCGISEYLDHSNCKCRKKLVDPLIEECTENIDIVTIDNENKGSFSIVYIVFIVLFSIILTICIGVGIYFVYYRCYLKKCGTRNETLIY